MDDYSGQQRELLERFSAALKSKSPDAWFDEDDIIEIFDYAGDIGNDYVRAEALMWGARYFPDSDRLHERRMVFYADVLNNNAVAEFASDNSDRKTALTAIIEQRAKTLDKDEALACIRRIVSENKSLDDESCIQLVNFAVDTGNLAWMFENLDTLRKKAEYVPALTYEMAAAAVDVHDYKNALPLLEELVEEMPYNADTWEMIASAYEDSGRLDEAIEAIDMALAIDPDHLASVTFKISVLASEGNVAEARKIYERFPDDMQVAERYMQAVITDLANREEALTSRETDLLIAFADKFPSSDYFMSLLLTYAPQHSREALDRYWHQCYPAGEEASPESWLSWARALVKTGAVQGAYEVLSYFKAHVFSLSEQFAIETDVYLAELCAMLHNFDEAYGILAGYDLDTLPYDARHAKVIFMIAAMNTGHEREALEAANKILYLDGTDSRPRPLEGFDIHDKLSDLGTRILAGSLLGDSSHFDPTFLL